MKVSCIIMVSIAARIPESSSGQAREREERKQV